MWTACDIASNGWMCLASNIASEMVDVVSLDLGKGSSFAMTIAIVEKSRSDGCISKKLQK